MCAPSNSAVDEIVLRLIYSGLMDETLRIGVKEAKHQDMVKVTLEERMKAKAIENFLMKLRAV